MRQGMDDGRPGQMAGAPVALSDGIARAHGAAAANRQRDAQFVSSTCET